jgi:hypothetical protein
MVTSIKENIMKQMAMKQPTSTTSASEVEVKTQPKARVESPETLAPETLAESKTRVQFDFTPEALQRLDDIKVKTHSATRAETLRNALKLYEWFVNEAEPDSTIKIVDKDNQIVTQFKARLLLG